VQWKFNRERANLEELFRLKNFTSPVQNAQNANLEQDANVDQDANDDQPDSEEGAKLKLGALSALSAQNL
jgi:hypothetical protein